MNSSQANPRVGAGSWWPAPRHVQIKLGTPHLPVYTNPAQNTSPLSNLIQGQKSASFSHPENPVVARTFLAPTLYIYYTPIPPHLPLSYFRLNSFRERSCNKVRKSPWLSHRLLQFLLQELVFVAGTPLFCCRKYPLCCRFFYSPYTLLMYTNVRNSNSLIHFDTTSTLSCQSLHNSHQYSQ